MGVIVRMDKLLEERKQLVDRMNWLSIRSPSYDRMEQRVKEIDRILKK